ncbi:MAG: lipoyl protein ligase domain-containing protein [Acidimicrobiales bacterium]
MSDGELFDPASLRGRSRRTAFVRTAEQPTLVLGSTQDAGVIDPRALESRGVALKRRRSGGGAVLVVPGATVWIDTWIPRGDPLWDDDVSRSRLWTGQWWLRALADAGTGAALSVWVGRPESTPWSSLICFAGVDVGEVVVGRRKLVGVSQWRAKQGSLTHAFAYDRVDWEATTALLAASAGSHDAIDQLEASTVTLGDLGLDPRARAVDLLIAQLPGPEPWDIEVSLG